MFLHGKPWSIKKMLMKSDVSYVLMPYSDLKEDIEITDVEIETYFQGIKKV